MINKIDVTELKFKAITKEGLEIVIKPFNRGSLERREDIKEIVGAVDLPITHIITSDFHNSSRIVEINPNKKRRKIYTKKSLGSAMHVMECPECGGIEASASESMYLPEFTTCDNEICNY